MLLDSIGSQNSVFSAIDGFDRDSNMEGDSILPVPFERIQKDVFDFVRSGNKTRQKDSVVICVRLVAEHDNVEVLQAVALGQFFDEASACHSIADHNQPSFFHRLTIL